MRAVDVRQERREGVLEGIGDEALRREMVNLVGLDLADTGVDAGKTLQTRRVKMDFVENGVEPREAMGGILQGGPPHQAVDLVALLQQQLRQIGAVLSRDARDASAFHGFSSFLWQETAIGCQIINVGVPCPRLPWACKDRRINNCRNSEGDSPIFVERKSGQSPTYWLSDNQCRGVMPTLAVGM